METIAARNPNVRAIMMGQHGFIDWHDDEKACYEQTLAIIERATEYIEKKYAEKGGDARAFGGAIFQTLPAAERREKFAAILPWLRGRVSRATLYRYGPGRRKNLALRELERRRPAGRAGHELPRSLPAHQDQALYVQWDGTKEDLVALKSKLTAGLEQYRQDYAAYYQRCKHPNSPAMRDPNPTVILIPGLGMIAWGKDKSESRVTAEFYNCAVEVMRGAEAIDEYISLPQQEAFDIEYWLLEEAKLKRMPAEKELARQVVVVIGAGSGIGKETAHRLVKDGAHIVCVDLNAAAAQETAKEITDKLGLGIGVAWKRPFRAAGLALGLAAATFTQPRQHPLDARGSSPSPMAGSIPSASPPVFSGRATPLAIFRMKKCGLHLQGSMSPAAISSPMKRPRFSANKASKAPSSSTTSANAVVAKKGSIAYDCSKAAANHLIRELAIELAPLVRVNGVAPATVVQGSAMNFPR